MRNYKKFFYYFALISTIIYIIFRIFYTLPQEFDYSLFFALIVLITETIDAIFFSIYTLNILVINNDIPKKPKLLIKDYPELDIFIATINEDKDLLEETIKHVKAMDYPDKKKLHIYLCDDGNRNTIRKLCKIQKINYITRNNNVDAKAGNYNNAINKTKSPYIVVFDADMKPSKDFLLKTVPYLFADKKVGFVQLPQNFDNPDIFQNKFKIQKYIPLELNYFYHRIQVSRNTNNSVIFCGTNAILSRKALKEIGGFATKTLTEDFATGLLIERAGYKGIALPYDEVYGKNVESISSLIKQRDRWCRGCIQTYKNYKIIYKSGLSFKQKLDYLSGIYYWFFGFRNIIYLLVPLLYSFFNIKIIQGNFLLFILLFFIQYVLKRFVIDRLEDRKVSSTWNRIYEVILSPVIFISSLLELLGFSQKKFNVSIKGKDNKKSYQYYYLVVFHLLLFSLNLLGLFVSVFKGMKYEFINYLIPIFWLGTNCIYLLFALIFDFSNSIDYKNNYINRTSTYSFLSIPVLFYQFILKEIKLKRVAFFAAIIIIIGLFININNYYEYRKTIIINNKSLVSYNGTLNIKNGNIVNKDGNIVRLKGLSTHNLYWYGRTYTKSNIQELVNTWGINTFRIALYTNPNEEGYIKNKSLIDEVEKIIDYCIDLDIYVIVDWHILKDNNPNIYKEEAIEFFDIISKKYKDVPNIIYEICNEPNGEDVTWNDEIRPYSEDLIKVIRNNSEKSLIIVGLADWCKDIKQASRNLLKDSNTLYAVHIYAGSLESDNLKEEINKAKSLNMPLIVTECGPTNESGDGNIYEKEFDEWIDFLENKNISWIVWQLSEKDEASSLLIKKEVQDRLDFLYGKYTEEELKRKKYHINDYLSDTGKFMKKVFEKYN